MILLLPFLVGGIVTLRAIEWVQVPVEPESGSDLAIAGPPLLETEPVVEAVRERATIAASREAERRPEPVEAVPMAVGASTEPSQPELISDPRIDDLVPMHYRSLILRTAERHGLDPRLLAAVIKLESRYDRNVVGTHGEVGLMQILASTGAWLAGLAGMESYDLRDDETSLELGAMYLAINLREHGTVEKALAVYNGGPRAAAGWQTNIYVKRVLQFYRGE